MQGITLSLSKEEKAKTIREIKEIMRIGVSEYYELKDKKKYYRSIMNLYAHQTQEELRELKKTFDFQCMEPIRLMNEMAQNDKKIQRIASEIEQVRVELGDLNKQLTVGRTSTYTVRNLDGKDDEIFQVIMEHTDGGLVSLKSGTIMKSIHGSLFSKLFNEKRILQNAKK